MSRGLLAPAAMAVSGSLGLIIAIGLVLRIAASRLQAPLVDEALSYLGAQMVAQRGVPLLPSGVLYLHGAVHSYLLAPLIALGIGTYDNLFPLRLVSAAAGGAAIMLTFRLARSASASIPASLFAAALLAIDPASVLWGGYVRMYALAQALAVAVAIIFLQAISPRDASSRRARRWTLWALVILFWLAVFTHLATALLWPAMAAVSVVVYGKRLLGEHRDLTLALLACLAAPLILIGLTGAIGPGAGTALEGRAEGLPGVSFLGEDNVNLTQLFHPNPAPWATLFEAGPLALIMPLLLALGSGLLIGRELLQPRQKAASSQARSVGALLALYWLPILALALFATDAAERYALFLLPIGYVLIALATDALFTPTVSRARVSWATVGGVTLVLALLVQGIAGSAHLELNQSGEQARFAPSLAYIAAHRQPGELILTSSAVSTALAVGTQPELRFLPGGEGSQRAGRYTRYKEQGGAIDYWIGMPSLPTTAALCASLQAAPGSWIMVSNRFWQNWGYRDLPPRQMERAAAAMQDLITGLADEVHKDQEAVLYRSRPPAEWNATARNACASGKVKAKPDAERDATPPRESDAS